MAIKHFSRVQEVASNTPNGATAFNLPGTAATGYRTFAACYANTDLLPYFATNGTDWESGIGTFTIGSPNTIVRTAILESSNAGSAVDFSAGSAVTLFVEWSAKLAETANATDVIPGGRLTLESGVPISATDQLAKTTIYYTPYVHNVIRLWNGSRWVSVEFAETSIALGTLTANIGYDVFAYLDGGVLALELLAWTNETTRATDVTLQDGRYCKNGDKTRLLLGSFYTDTATTTVNAKSKRFLYNFYNKTTVDSSGSGSTSHTYTTATLREFNGGTNVTRQLLFNGDVVYYPHIIVFKPVHQGANLAVVTGFSVNGANAAFNDFYNGTTHNPSFSTIATFVVGYNYVYGLEQGGSGITFVAQYWGSTWNC